LKIFFACGGRRSLGRLGIERSDEPDGSAGIGLHVDAGLAAVTPQDAASSLAFIGEMSLAAQRGLAAAINGLVPSGLASLAQK
jgi:hypothetical protein